MTAAAGFARHGGDGGKLPHPLRGSPLKRGPDRCGGDGGRGHEYQIAARHGGDGDKTGSGVDSISTPDPVQALYSIAFPPSGPAEALAPPAADALPLPQKLRFPAAGSRPITYYLLLITY